MKEKFYSIVLIILFISSLMFSPVKAEQSKNIYQLLFEGQYDQAVLALQDSVRADSSKSKNYYLLGLAYNYQNNHSNALINFLKAESLDVGNTNNLSALAGLYASMGQYQKAEGKYFQILVLDTTRNDARNSLGKLFYKQAKYKKSLFQFDELCKSDSLNSYYHHLKAKCLANLDSLDLSIEHYKLANKLNPSNSDINLELAKILFKVEEYDSALVYVQAGIEVNKHSSRLNRVKADILHKQEKYAEAIRSYLDALFNGDKSAECIKKLGYCFYREGKVKEAMGMFTVAAEKDDRDPVIPFYQGICCRTLEEHVDAINYFQLAEKLIIPQYFHNLYAMTGECLHDIEEYEQAIKAYRKALEYKPGNPNYDYLLANVYYDYYADREVPLMYYQKVVREDVSPEVTQYAQERVEELIKEVHFGKK
jgi:tetratricopeptide (TPR) repeat protein